MVIVHDGVKSTNVVCSHNGTCDLCIFAIFSKTGFMDIVPLCCKPSTRHILVNVLNYNFILIMYCGGSYLLNRCNSVIVTIHSLFCFVIHYQLYC